MATIDEDALYNELRQLPDFDCLPLPSHWFKKYKIEPVKAQNPKEFCEYKMKEPQKVYNLPPIVIDEPQQNGKTFEVFPAEQIDVKIVSRPFDWDSSRPFPATLPYLKEQEEKEKSSVV